MSGWYLAHVEVENFKSIVRASVQLQEGMTVITGPNGSGKSNFIDCIAFALGVEIQALRVSSISELGGQPSQRVRVELTFKLRRSTQTMKLACYILEMQRVYKVDGIKVSKEKRRAVLSFLGFAKDSICYHIGQSSVQKIITASPKALYHALTFVSGTHLLQEARTKVTVERDILTKQMNDLQGVLTEVDETLLADQQMLKALDYAKAQEMELDEALKGSERVEQELSVLLHLKVQVEADRILVRLAEIAVALDEDSLTPESGCLSAQELYDQMKLKEKELYQASAEYLLEREEVEMINMRLLISRTALAGNLQLKDTAICNLGRQMEAYDALNAIMATIETESEMTQLRVSRLMVATENEIKGVFISIEQECQECSGQLQQLITLMMTTTAQLTQSQEFQDVSSHQLCILQNRTDCLQENLGHRLSVEGNATNEKHYTKETASLALISIKAEEIRQELSKVCENLRLNDRLILKALIPGDLGIIAELLVPMINNSSKYGTALVSILKPFLTVHICETNHAATLLMTLCQHEHQECRIWVLERLNRTKQSIILSSLLLAHMGDVVDPRTLVKYDPRFPLLERVVEKLFSSWAIVCNSSLVKEVIDKGISCVTLDGHKHSLGSITLHHRHSSGPTVQNIALYGKLTAEYRDCREQESKLIATSSALIAELKKYKDSSESFLTIVALKERQSNAENELEYWISRGKQLAIKLTNLRERHDELNICFQQRKINIEILKKESLSDDGLRNALLDKEVSIRDGLNSKFHDVAIKRGEMEKLISATEEQIVDLRDKELQTTTEINSLEFDAIAVHVSATDMESMHGRLNRELISIVELLKEASRESASTTLDLNLDREKLKNLTMERVSLEKKLSALRDRYDLNEGMSGESFEKFGYKTFDLEREIKVEEDLILSNQKVEMLARNLKETRRILQKMLSSEGGKQSPVMWEEIKVSLASKRNRFNDLKSKTCCVTEGIQLLTQSLTEVETLMANTHLITFHNLRARVKLYFGDLVPGKAVDLIFKGERLDEGLKFVLINKDGLTSLTDDLSGGEKSLLGLSFIFASALHKQSPLYLLDEVDAALDETNIQLIATIIKKIFGENQAVCVSHHAQFHMRSFNKLPVTISDGVSYIG